MHRRKSTSRGERQPALVLNGARTPPIRRRLEQVRAQSPKRAGEELPALVMAPVGARMRPHFLELREGVVVRAVEWERGVCSCAWADDAGGEIASFAAEPALQVAEP